MAPVPKENEDKPSNGREVSDTNDFSNPNHLHPIDIMGSSEESDSESESAPGGYTLLPQGPEDSGDDEFNSDSGEEIQMGRTDFNPEQITDFAGALACADTETVPDEVLSSEAGAEAPTVSASQSSLHPEFLAKFPTGFIPSYMQVPDKHKGDQLWNQKSKATLESAPENQILKAMSGFSLPTENIPDWAKSLEGDQWQHQVVSRIRGIPDVGKHHLEEQTKDDPTEEGWTANFEDAG